MFRTVDGLVIRSIDYKEADKLLTIMTRGEGIITARAVGARRKNSKLSAASQLLVYAEFTVFENREFISINEVNIKEMFTGLRANIEKLSLGIYFAELLSFAAQEDVSSPEMLSLGLNSLYAAANLDKPLSLIKAAFELRLLALMGYEPELDCCAGCGKPLQNALVDINGGTVCCPECSAGRGIHMPLGFSALEAVRYVLSCPPKRLFSFGIEADKLKQMADFSEAFLKSQLETGFKTLDFYKQFQAFSPEDT